MTAPAASAAALRMRRTRQRRREGAVVRRVTVAAETVPALIAAGEISPEDAADPDLLSWALGAVLDRAAGVE